MLEIVLEGCVGGGKMHWGFQHGKSNGRSIKQQAMLKIQSRVQSCEQPVRLSGGFEESGWVPFSTGTSEVTPGESGQKECWWTDGHTLHPSPDASTCWSYESLGKTRKAPGWFLPTIFWSLWGIAEQATGKLGHRDRPQDRQTACSGWHRQNSSVLSSCPICILAKSLLALDEAEIVGWNRKDICWSDFFSLACMQQESDGLVAQSICQEPLRRVDPSTNASCWVWSSQWANWSGLKISRCPSVAVVIKSMGRCTLKSCAHPFRSNTSTGTHPLC